MPIMPGNPDYVAPNTKGNKPNQDNNRISRIANLVTSGALFGIVLIDTFVSIPNAKKAGIEQGIEQATSNLTTAVTDITSFSRDCLNHRSTHMGKGYGPTNENERAGMQTGLSVGRYFADLTELTIKKEGARIANGQTTVSNELGWLIEAERTERVIKAGYKPCW